MTNIDHRNKQILLGVAVLVVAMATWVISACTSTRTGSLSPEQKYLTTVRSDPMFSQGSDDNLLQSGYGVCDSNRELRSQGINPDALDRVASSVISRAAKVYLCPNG